jgi:AraC-like DNA-binding protein
MENYVEILKSNPEYFKQFSCKDLLFLNYDCPVKETRLPIWSEHNYFYYVLLGRKSIHTPTRSWALEQGSFVFVKKGACIKESFFEQPFCIIVFIIPDSFISTFVNNNRQHLPAFSGHHKFNDLVLSVNPTEMLKGFCQSILPYFTLKSPPSEPLIELKFNELLMHLLNDSQNADLISYMHAVATNRSGKIEEVMEANYAYNLTLPEYAKLCTRSLSSFKRDFEIHFKTTPGQWLLGKRLQHAWKLLMDTDKPIADIMLESGFENQAHFTTSFKNRFGHPPMKYRKRMESIGPELLSK